MARRRHEAQRALPHRHHIPRLQRAVGTKRRRPQHSRPALARQLFRGRPPPGGQLLRMRRIVLAQPRQSLLRDPALGQQAQHQIGVVPADRQPRREALHLIRRPAHLRPQLLPPRRQPRVIHVRMRDHNPPHLLGPVAVSVELRHQLVPRAGVVRPRVDEQQPLLGGQRVYPVRAQRDWESGGLHAVSTRSACCPRRATDRLTGSIGVGHATPPRPTVPCVPPALTDRAGRG